MADSVERWYEVVSGRTPKVDRWWRVTPGIPAIPDLMDWLSAAVHAVVAGGKGLDQPRFLLAQDRRVRLVGMACQAARLSATMHTEYTDAGQQGGRALYTFVGWLTPRDPNGFPPTPDLPALIEHGTEWCGPVYERWAGRTWHESLADARRNPRYSAAAMAPWTADTDRAGQALASAAVRPGCLLLVPEREIANVWQAALSATDPILVTAGWQNSARVPRQAAMYAGVSGIDSRTVVEISTYQPETPTALAPKAGQRTHGTSGTSALEHDVGIGSGNESQAASPGADKRHRRDNPLDWAKNRAKAIRNSSFFLDESFSDDWEDGASEQVTLTSFGEGDIAERTDASPPGEGMVKRVPPREPAGQGPMRRFLTDDASQRDRRDGPPKKER